MLATRIDALINDCRSNRSNRRTLWQPPGAVADATGVGLQARVLDGIGQFFHPAELQVQVDGYLWRPYPRPSALW